MSNLAGENGGVSQRPANCRRDASSASPLPSSQGPSAFSPASCARRISASGAGASGTPEIGLAVSRVWPSLLRCSLPLGVLSGPLPMGPRAAKRAPGPWEPSAQPPLATVVEFGSPTWVATSTPVSSNSSRNAHARSPGRRSGSCGDPSLSALAAVQPPGARSLGVPSTGRFASPRSRPPPGKACQPPMNGRISPRCSQKSSMPSSGRRRRSTTAAEPRAGLGAASSPPAAASTFS